MLIPFSYYIGTFTLKYNYLYVSQPILVLGIQQNDSIFVYLVV